MQKRIFSLVIILLILQTVHSQKLRPNQFVIKGRIGGLKSGMIYLDYRPEGKADVIDSSIIKGGIFGFKGFINEPGKAFLSTFNLQAPNLNHYGNNITEFYLEAGNIKISAAYNQFRNLKVSGSSSDSDRVSLEKSEQTILNDIQKNQDLYNQYRMELKKTLDTIQRHLLKSKLDSLYDVSEILWKRKLPLDSAFIVQHPNSYLAADMLANSSYSNIAFPSLENLYSRFPLYIRESAAGIKIKTEIEKERQVYIGKPAFDFVALTEQKDTIKLHDFKGKKYVLLDFWASWCRPCRRITPILNEMHRKYQDSLEIISVSYSDKEDAWHKAIAEDKPRWPQILGNKAGSTLFPVDQSIPDLYYIDLLPSLLLIDKKSLIVEKFGGWYNSRPISELSQKLDYLFHPN